MSNASVHWFNSFIRFIASIPYFDSLIRFIEGVYTIVGIHSSSFQASSQASFKGPLIYDYLTACCMFFFDAVSICGFVLEKALRVSSNSINKLHFWWEALFFSKWACMLLDEVLAPLRFFWALGSDVVHFVRGLRQRAEKSRWRNFYTGFRKNFLNRF